DFKPTAAIRPGRPTPVSFVIRRPDGRALTHFRRGAGPHTGVHVIFVRNDLAYLIHRHPPIDAHGTITDRVTFPAPGRYRVVVDAYPAGGSQPNFQLFRTVHVAGTYRPEPLPAAHATDEVGGYRFMLSGGAHLRAIQAEDVVVHVTG